MDFCEALYDSIKDWERRVRRETQDQNFRAIPHIAKICGLEKRAVYNWLDNDKNGCKMGVRDLIEITALTKDFDILKSVETKVTNKIKLNSIGAK